MTTVTESDALTELLERFVTDLGATMCAGNVVIGDQLGLYRALAESGPLTSRALAEATGTAERMVREWLAGQAASGHITHHPAGRHPATRHPQDDRYSMNPSQALAFADPDGLGLPGAFQLALAALADRPAVTRAFRDGDGMSWGEHHPDLFTGTDRFFRPGYVANLVNSWIPAVPGLHEQLTAGTTVADVGCGLGTTARIIAQTYPSCAVRGFDNHAGSIELARKATADDARCRFEIGRAQDFPGHDYGLVATFDSLHDMGDPLGAARHIRSALADGGVWLIVEPNAGDVVADNLNPVGRMYYGFSTFVCVPHAMSEGAADAWGNQAGERVLADLTAAAGFGQFRQVAQTPFNLVYEARP